MANESEIPLGTGLPETVLPAPPPDWSKALEEAGTDSASVRELLRQHPRYIDAWGRLAELSDDEVDSYAYARVGYHRGLDALRAAGWRGSGYVRWRQETNRGFLRSLEALWRAAGAIGEEDETERCRQFLRQLDPSLQPGQLPRAE